MNNADPEKLHIIGKCPECGKKLSNNDLIFRRINNYYSAVVCNHCKVVLEVSKSVRGKTKEPDKIKHIFTHINVDHPEFDEIRDTFNKQPFEDIWNNIFSSQGNGFYTKTGLPFTYEIKDENWLYTSRSKYPIHKNDIKKCYSYIPIQKPTHLDSHVHGVSSS